LLIFAEFRVGWSNFFRCSNFSKLSVAIIDLMRCIQQTHARCLPLGGRRLITEVVTPARRVATISRRIVRLARTWPKVFSHMAEPLLIVTVISQSHITNQTLFSTHQDGCVGSWGNDSDDYSTSHGTTWFFLVSEFNMVFLLTKLHFIGKQQNQVIHIFHHHQRWIHIWY
jgi:hypothetical protein